MNHHNIIINVYKIKHLGMQNTWLISLDFAMSKKQALYFALYASTGVEKWTALSLFFILTFH